MHDVRLHGNSNRPISLDGMRCAAASALQEKRTSKTEPNGSADTRRKPKSRFWGMAPLLLKIPEEIADCLARAEEASQRAQHETNERLKVEWLDIEHRWRHLAESLKFVDQANRFLDDALHSRSEGRVP